MWKARGDSGLSKLADQTMATAELCLKIIAKKEGFKLVTDRIQCPNVCFWYIPKFMRGKDEDEKWWDLMHKVSKNSYLNNKSFIIKNSEKLKA